MWTKQDSQPFRLRVRCFGTRVIPVNAALSRTASLRNSGLPADPSRRRQAHAHQLQTPAAQPAQNRAPAEPARICLNYLTGDTMTDHNDLLADAGPEDLFEKEMRGYSRRRVDEFVARNRSQIRDLEERLSRAPAT